MRVFPEIVQTVARLCMFEAAEEVMRIIGKRKEREKNGDMSE